MKTPTFGLVLESALSLVLLLLLLVFTTKVEARSYQFHLAASKSWVDAENFCKTTYGTNLATVDSASDQTTLRNAMSSAGATMVWIGLNDIVVERGNSKLGWVWSSGATYSFNFFTSGEPFDEPGKDEDCVAILDEAGFSNFEWINAECSIAVGFACDAVPATPFPTTPKPTTSTPTTSTPTTSKPTTSNPTTSKPTTSNPTTSKPTTSNPTTSNPTTSNPTTSNPSPETITLSPTLQGNQNGGENEQKKENKNNLIPIAVGSAVGASLMFAFAVVYIRKRRQRSASGIVSKYEDSLPPRTGQGALSAEFDRIANSNPSSRISILGYLGQLSPTHYYHKSRQTLKEGIKTYKVANNYRADALALPPPLGIPTPYPWDIPEETASSVSGSGITPHPPGLGFSIRVPAAHNIHI